LDAVIERHFAGQDPIPRGFPLSVHACAGLENLAIARPVRVG